MKPRSLLLAPLLLIAVTLTACGDDGKEATSSAGEDSSWSYTSGNGDTITLDHKPERIIASAAEAAGLLAYGIKPVGIFVRPGPRATSPASTEFDLAGIEIVGKEWGNIDAEKVAALEPDLIVADWWPPQKAYQGFEEGVDAESLKVEEARAGHRRPPAGLAARGGASGTRASPRAWAWTSNASEPPSDRQRFDDCADRLQGGRARTSPSCPPSPWRPPRTCCTSPCRSTRRR